MTVIIIIIIIVVVFMIIITIILFYVNLSNLKRILKLKMNQILT